MLQAISTKGFKRLSLSDKWLVLEACFQLLIARFHTLCNARHFTSMMGELEGRPIAADHDQRIRAARIGYIVAKAARLMPFRSVCLQQVLAVRRMLRRRHIPATVYLGVLPNVITRPGVQDAAHLSKTVGSAAHAWVKTGEQVINGDSVDLDDYVVVGIFS